MPQKMQITQMMCSENSKMKNAVIKLLMLASLISCCTSEFSCPSAVELGTNVTLICSFPKRTSIYYSAPNTPDYVAYCLRNGTCTSTSSGYTAAYLSSTHSQFNINSVKKSDEGMWNCTDENAPLTSACTFAVLKSPSCFIEGNRDTQNLVENVKVSLMVNITDFHCSKNVRFLLQTGDKTEPLVKNDHMNNTEQGVYYAAFTVTDYHHGSLDLHFICNNVKKKVQCEGVTSLSVSNQNIIIIAASVSAAVFFMIAVMIIVICVWRNGKCRTNNNDDTNNDTGIDNRGNDTMAMHRLSNTASPESDPPLRPGDPQRNMNTENAVQNVSNTNHNENSRREGVLSRATEAHIYAQPNSRQSEAHIYAQVNIKSGVTDDKPCNNMDEGRYYHKPWC